MNTTQYTKIVCYIHTGHKIPVLVAQDCTDCVAEIGVDAIEENLSDTYYGKGEILCLGVFEDGHADSEIEHWNKVIEAISEV